MHPRATRNPWDLTRTPGGSSSGSAAAVAVGAISVGLATQVFGSILRPSSFCGCFGFKPTVGAINRGGSHDALSQSTHGPIAASLPEAWAVAYEIVAPRRRRPRLSGPLRAADLPAPIEAAPARRSGNRRAGRWRRPRRRQAFAEVSARLKSAGVALASRHESKTVAAVEDAIADARGALP